MQSLIDHHCGDKETIAMDNINTARSTIVTYLFKVSMYLKAVMALRMHLLLKITEVVTIMVTRRPCVPVV